MTRSRVSLSRRSVILLSLCAVLVSTSRPAYAFFGKIKKLLGVPKKFLNKIGSGDFEGAFNIGLGAFKDVKGILGAVGGNPIDIISQFNSGSGTTVPSNMEGMVRAALEGNSAIAMKALANSSRQLEAANRLNEKQLAMIGKLAESNERTVKRLIEDRADERKKFFDLQNKSLDIIERISWEALFTAREISEDSNKTIRELDERSQEFIDKLYKDIKISTEKRIEVEKKFREDLKNFVERYVESQELKEAKRKALLYEIALNAVTVSYELQDINLKANKKGLCAILQHADGC